MSLLSYSGITTKVRAMSSHLLSEEQFREMASLEDVRSAADYLKKQPAYAEIFTGLDDTMLHRAFIERLLAQSEYRDFSKLYRFSNASQRRFLDLYFAHFEINMIKRILRNVMASEQAALDLSQFRKFFEKHSSIDFPRLAQSADIQEFIANLGSSIYGSALKDLASSADHPLTLFDLEMRLDLLHISTMWKAKNKSLPKKEQQIITQSFGPRLDLLNIQWIYRSKKYYSLPAADIYALLIPVNYKLKQDQIIRLVEADDIAAFFRMLQSTYYGKFTDRDLAAVPDLEALYQQILERIYSTNSHRHPYTAAILDSYLYFKEQEMQKIITTIEGIRYGMDESTILSMVIKH